jgi:hypothetical protein
VPTYDLDGISVRIPVSSISDQEPMWRRRQDLNLGPAMNRRHLSKVLVLPFTHISKIVYFYLMSGIPSASNRLSRSLGLIARVLNAAS